MKKMKLSALFAFVAFWVAPYANALTVTVDGAKTWNGYMSWFNLNSDGSSGAYVSGSPWGLADLKTTISGNTITLQPNFNTYANGSGDPYWRSGGGTGPLGNKFMEASSYVEYGANTLTGTSNLTFEGVIDSYTLASGYNAIAFIKALNPNAGYSTDLFRSASLQNGSSFSISADVTTFTGMILQYGFTVYGANANPADALTLGSAVVSAVPEPSSATLMGLGVTGLLAFRMRRKV